MTKREMVNRIAVEAGLPKSRVAQVVELFLEEVEEELVKEGRVELRGFGVWSVSRRPAHKGHHPKTGEPLQVEAVSYVKFKAGRALKAALQVEEPGR